MPPKGSESSLIAALNSIAEVIKTFQPSTTGQWELLGEMSLDADGDLMTLELDSDKVRNFLRIEIHALKTGTALDTTMIFNNDTGSNYVYNTTTNASIIGLDSGTNAGDALVIIEITNVLDRIKMGKAESIESEGNNETSAMNYRDYPIKWDNTTEQIKRVDYSNTGSSTNILAGSTIKIWGHN